MAKPYSGDVACVLLHLSLYKSTQTTIPIQFGPEYLTRHVLQRGLGPIAQAAVFTFALWAEKR